MKYGPWRLFVLIGMIAFLLLLIIALIFLLLRKKCFALILDNREEQDICLGGVSSYSVSQNMSGELGVIKKSLFGDLSFIYSKNTTEHGKKVKLVDEIPIEIQYEEDGIRTNSLSLMIRKSEKNTNTNEGSTDETGIY